MNLQQGVLTTLLKTSGTVKSMEAVPGTAVPSPQAPDTRDITRVFEGVGI